MKKISLNISRTELDILLNFTSWSQHFCTTEEARKRVTVLMDEKEKMDTAILAEVSYAFWKKYLAKRLANPQKKDFKMNISLGQGCALVKCISFSNWDGIDKATIYCILTHIETQIAY